MASSVAALLLANSTVAASRVSESDSATGLFEFSTNLHLKQLSTLSALQLDKWSTLLLAHPSLQLQQQQPKSSQQSPSVSRARSQSSLAAAGAAIANSDVKTASGSPEKATQLDESTAAALSPAVFCKNKQATVTALNLSVNRLTSAAGLNALAQTLRSLDLSRNMLSTLKQLVPMPNLTSLNVSNNQLTSLLDLRSLPQLTQLNASMNRLAHLRGLVAVPALRSLFVFGNELQSLSGIDACPKLNDLQAQRNQLTEAAQIGLLQQLTTLNLSSNRLSDFESLMRSLRASSSLSSLHMQGNPLCEQPHYRMRLIQLPSLRFLDNLAVKPEARAQFVDFHLESDLQPLIEAVTREYNARIAAERERKEQILRMLKEQERWAHETFDQYQRSMENELNDTVSYLLRLKSGVEHDAKAVFARSPQGIASWAQELKRLEEERLKLAADAEANKQATRSELLARARLVSFADKMYEISLKRPDLWRELKRRQAEQDSEQEQKEAAFRESKLHEAHLARVSLASQLQANASANGGASAGSTSAFSLASGADSASSAIALARTVQPPSQASLMARAALGHAKILSRLHDD